MNSKTKSLYIYRDQNVLSPSQYGSWPFS